MQVTKLFEIEDYNLWEDDLEVFTDKKEYYISRKKYEDWLRWDDRLNWEMNLSDHNGEHVQEVGVMSLEEYWNSDRTAILEDIYKYIVVKIEKENVFDVFNALGNILNHSFSHFQNTTL